MNNKRLIRIIAIVLAVLLVGGVVVGALMSALAEGTPEAGVRNQVTLTMEYLEDEQALAVGQCGVHRMAVHADDPEQEGLDDHHDQHRDHQRDRPFPNLLDDLRLAGGQLLLRLVDLLLRVRIDRLFVVSGLVEAVLVFHLQ